MESKRGRKQNKEIRKMITTVYNERVYFIIGECRERAFACLRDCVLACFLACSFVFRTPTRKSKSRVRERLAPSG